VCERTSPLTEKNLPTVRCHRSVVNSPPPTSNNWPVTGQLSWHRYATSGVTADGFSSASTSGVITSSVMRDAAVGAIVFTNTFFFSPSRASVFARPTTPIW
jgi:hypothetical protein